MKQRMQNSYEKGLAIYSALSFALGIARCTAKRKQGNRWGGYRAPKRCNPDADALDMAEGNMSRNDSASSCFVRRSRRPQTRLETSCTSSGRPRRHLRLNQAAGRRAKAKATRPPPTSLRGPTGE